ncbi:MAG: hypothetical protein B7Z10_03370 [Rhodobacterales bacterium 32-66-7]|nr:MAG: hypothetical protein B7Z10_03370 [Rhodobacterales bacterium 32-66-7]
MVMSTGLDQTLIGLSFLRGDVQSTFQIADLTLDLGKGRLFHGGADVVLRAKSFALLSYLVRANGRVVSKDELMSALWPDVTVTEDSLTRCVHEVRQALGPGAARFLRTVQRRGYLFQAGDGAVPARPWAGADPGSVAVTADPPPPEGTQPLRREGIAVMPFVLTSGGPNDATLLDGLAHDVISRLARLRSFHVIARGSTFALRHLAADPQAAGRALGVAYVFVGAAKIDHGLVRLQVDLVDASDGRIVWTDEVAEPRVAHADLTDSLADRLTQAIFREVTSRERNRAMLSPQGSLDAWQSYHRGLFHMLQFSPTQSSLARTLFDQAVQQDLGFARADAGLSYCYFLEAFLQPRGERRADIDLALRSASRAIELDEQGPSSWWAYGRVLWLMGDVDGGLKHLQTAIKLSPSFAMGHQTLAFMLSQSGNPDESLAYAERASALSPHDPFMCAIYGSNAIALLRSGRTEEAAAMSLMAARQPNAHKHILAVAAVALAAAGQEGAARSLLSRVRNLDQHYSMTKFADAFAGLTDDAVSRMKTAGSRIGLV